jgi:hypothetical protein
MEVAMTALRKNRKRATSYSPPPEAFDYDADVTEEAVRSVEDRARKARGDEELEVVEGYVRKGRR